MIELWQTEWCPASRRIRERLTELDVSYLAHQVPVDKEARTVLMAAVGSDSIPTLVVDGGPALIGEDAIGSYLDEHIAEPAGAGAHREKAARARRRELEDASAALLTPIHPHAQLSEVSQ